MVVTHIPFSFPGIDTVRCAFGCRTAGDMALPDSGEPAAGVENRRGFAASVGVPGWVELRQVHGDAIVFDPATPPAPLPAGQLPEADGAATSRAHSPLAVKTADCQPLLLAHRSGRYVAALHVGWRGNRMRFPVSGVRAFCERYGFSPETVLAVRGPSLGPGRSEFVHYDREWGPEYDRWHDQENATVDLWRMTRDQLMEAGLLPGNIFGLDLCTMSLPEWFFSYRRGRETGRQISLIWIDSGRT